MYILIDKCFRRRDLKKLYLVITFQASNGNSFLFFFMSSAIYSNVSQSRTMTHFKFFEARHFFKDKLDDFVVDSVWTVAEAKSLQVLESSYWGNNSSLVANGTLSTTPPLDGCPPLSCPQGAAQKVPRKCIPFKLSLSSFRFLGSDSKTRGPIPNACRPTIESKEISTSKSSRSSNPSKKLQLRTRSTLPLKEIQKPPDELKWNFFRQALAALKSRLIASQKSMSSSSSVSRSLRWMSSSSNLGWFIRNLSKMKV